MVSCKKSPVAAWLDLVGLGQVYQLVWHPRRERRMPSGFGDWERAVSCQILLANIASKAAVPLRNLYKRVAYMTVLFLPTMVAFFF
jgi:hypothetical protein